MESAIAGVGRLAASRSADRAGPVLGLLKELVRSLVHCKPLAGLLINLAADSRIPEPRARDIDSRIGDQDHYGDSETHAKLLRTLRLFCRVFQVLGIPRPTAGGPGLYEAQ